MRQITHVVKRDGRVVPFTKVRVANAIYRAAVAVGGRDADEAERMADRVVEYIERRPRQGAHPAVEDFQDAIEKVLIENGKAKTAKAFILYRAERAKRRGERAAHAGRVSDDPIPWKKVWQALNWAIDHNVHTIESLNRRIRAGEFGQLVRECEAAYELDIARAADGVLARRDQLKLVIVAGPSSSGKTTTTIKISRHLANEGFKFIPFHVDNYFHNLDLHPKDEYGDYDYETPQALNLELIHDHLSRLLSGREARVPYFDFKAGKRIDGHHEMRLEAGEILLIDSHHGLHPAVSGSIAADAKFRLYIEPLLEMRAGDGSYVRWTDLRLLRRMTRDRDHRNVDPRRTIEHWHYVRNAEMDHIVPHANAADAVVNGAMAYELPVMKRRWHGTFRDWAAEYAGRHDRADAAARAARVLALFDSLADISAEDENQIPDDSVFREFIGGRAGPG